MVEYGTSDDYVLIRLLTLDHHPTQWSVSRKQSGGESGVLRRNQAEGDPQASV